MDSFLKIFENPSVSAFLGAFSAYILVILTDWRRKKNKKKIIKDLIETSLRLTGDKVEAIRNTIIALEKDKKLIAGPIMEYSIEDIRKLKLEILNYFKSEEKLALDTICYHMSEVDNFIKMTVVKAEDLRNAINISKEKRTEQAELLLTDYRDVLANLIRIEEMCQHYLNNGYSQIIQKKYKGLDYYAP